MRIALLSESREFGGAEQYLLLLAEGLGALGHEPVFLIPAGAAWRARAREGPWIVEECPRPYGVWLPLRMIWLASALRRLRPDVLHINLPSTYAASFTAGALMGQVQGCRVVTTEHLSMVGRSRRRVLLKGIFTRYVRRIIAVSNATRRCLVSDHGVDDGKITVVLNGVDPKALQFASREEARSRLGIDGDGVAIGSIGELIARKGHSFLIDSMVELQSRLPDRVRLVIIGDGQARADLEAQVAEKGLGDNVKFAGRVERAGSLLKAFDIFAMPSLMEALPFALLEAMAAGVPAVATSVWGIPEVVVDGETGLLVPPADTPELTWAILRLLEDDDLRASMGAAAESVASEKFSLQAMASRTAEIYEELAGAR